MKWLVIISVSEFGQRFSYKQTPSIRMALMHNWKYKKQALDLESPMEADRSTGLFALYSRGMDHGLFWVQMSAQEPHSFYHRQKQQIKQEENRHCTETLTTKIAQI